MKKIDIDKAERRVGSSYPAPFHESDMNKFRRRLARAAGLTEFGINLLTLRPGAWSSQRHWHSHNDEFVFVVSGEVVLVTDASEEVLRAGDCAGFKAGDPDGHHLNNRSHEDAVVLEIGTDHGYARHLRRLDAQGRDGISAEDLNDRRSCTSGSAMSDGLSGKVGRSFRFGR
jgi:uncharacterized cupin superfamily protein